MNLFDIIEKWMIEKGLSYQPASTFDGFMTQPIAKWIEIQSSDVVIVGTCWSGVPGIKLDPSDPNFFKYLEEIMDKS